MTENPEALCARLDALRDVAYWANEGWNVPGAATQKIGEMAKKAAAMIRALVNENTRLLVALLDAERKLKAR